MDCHQTPRLLQNNQDMNRHHLEILQQSYVEHFEVLEVGFGKILDLEKIFYQFMYVHLCNENLK